MNSLKVELLNPKALRVLRALEDLKIIRIQKDNNDFEKFLWKFRNQVKEQISFKEISKEVMMSRKKRYNL